MPDEFTDETPDQPQAPSESGLPGLAPEDQAALEALLNARANPDLSGSKAGSPATPIGRLLALLDAPVGDVDGEADTALADLTYLRVMRATELADDRLAPASADALDAWVQGGFDATSTPSVFRDQATQHERLAHLCTAPVADESAGRAQRIDRVLAQIQEGEDAQGDRLRLESRRSGLSSLRWGDIVSIAAMLLLATAVVLPVLSSVRQTQREELCKSNLNGVGGAMGMYANSYGSMLPMASAGLGGTWLDVGSTPERSNSANLYLLVRTNHVPLEQLACPGNPEAPTVSLSPNQQDWRKLEEVSYSYQVTPAGVRPSWGSSERRIVMADRSPVILRLVRGDKIFPKANSTNHAGEGQHALMSDGTTEWLRSPVVEGDNIWLPRVAEDSIRDARARLGLRGDERPTSERDVFLAP